ncbi:MAG: cytochrome c biogenesis CcdA family protein [Candidatus Humimicrobiaceae bacterium]
MNKIKQDFPEIELVNYELSEKDNTTLLFYLFDAMSVDDLDFKIPVVFIGDQMFLGEEEFYEGFEKSLNEALGKNQFHDASGELIKKYYTGASEVREPVEKNYIRIPVVIASALADSINPCAIGVIIILISSIIASKNRKYALAAGIIYIAVIFIVYFLLGVGFIYLVRNIHIPKLVFIILGSLLIVFGLFSAKDFFWYQKGFSLGIPGPIKQIIEKNIYKATIISILVIGVLISIFEATCSGAVYFGILSIISKSGMSVNSLLMLLLYNFIFVLPLLIILLVFYFGVPAKKVQRLFIQKNRRIYRLVLGLMLILLGVYLIVWL